MEQQPVHTGKIALKRESGFYLIEVMVTVIVLTVGLLGLGSLQVQSKQSNLVAAQRSFANHLSHDLLERIRSNGGALATYFPTDSVRVLTGSSLTQPSQPCSSAAQCDPAQLAAYDLWEWEQKLGGAHTKIGSDNSGILLSPTACLFRPSGGGNGAYTIAIVWRSTKPISNPVISDNTTANACGTTTGNYNYETSGDNKMRHLFWIDSYLSTG